MKFTKVRCLQNFVDLQYTSINTPRGLYQYQHLPYRVASAPAIWQRAMDQVLQDLVGIQYYLDDIIIPSRMMEEHPRTLDDILQCLKKYGLKAKPR